MTRMMLLVLVAVPIAALAQDEDEESFQGTISVPGMQMNINVREGKGRSEAEIKTSAHEEIVSHKPGEAFKLAYDADPAGRTMLKVLAPEGLGVRISEGMSVRHQDSIPTSFTASGGHFYRIEVYTPQAVVFDKKFEAKEGMIGQLWVSAQPAAVNVSVSMTAAPAPAPAPAREVRACMGAPDLSAVKREIDDADFSASKISVLESAAKRRWFCVAQVVEVLEQFDFSADKLQALRIMKARIVDGENHYKIYGALDFEADKEEAKRILGD
jgi:hypothetical protein